MVYNLCNMKGLVYNMKGLVYMTHVINRSSANLSIAVKGAQDVIDNKGLSVAEATSKFGVACGRQNEHHYVVTLCYSIAWFLSVSIPCFIG